MENYGYICTPKMGTSKKGNEYVCLEITFPNGYKKIVFVDNAERYLVINDILNGDC